MSELNRDTLKEYRTAAQRRLLIAMDDAILDAIADHFVSATEVEILVAQFHRCKRMFKFEGDVK